MIDSSSQHTKQPYSKINLGSFDCYEDQLQLKTVPALKVAFNHWIRSLAMEQRFLALKIYSYPIPQTLRKLLIKLQVNPAERCLQFPPVNQLTSAKTQTLAEVKKPAKEIEKAFLESLVLVSDGYEYLDHICFDFNFLKHFEKVFDLLLMPVSDYSSKLLLSAINNRKTPLEVAEKLKDCASLQEVSVETINFLRQEILIKFRDVLRQPEILSHCLDEEKKKKKEFNTYFKTLSEDARKQMILLKCQTIQQVHKWFSFRQITIHGLELVKEVEILTKLQKKQFCNRIFRCKIRKLMNPIIDYHQQIYNLWKSEVGKNRKRKFSKKISQQKLQQSKDQVEKLSAFKKHKKRHKKSNSVESNETNVTQHKKTQKLIQIETDFQPKEKPQPQVFFKNALEDEVQKDFKHLSPPQPVEKKKHNKKRKAKQQKVEEVSQVQRKSAAKQPLKCKEVKIQEKPTDEENKLISKQTQMKEKFFEKIGQELQQFADSISQQANNYYDRRIIAFERIQFLLSYYNIQIQLFGSCASGIAIKNSDIDIAVKSEILLLFEYLPQHMRLMAALQNLQNIFATQPFISEMKVISTAAIPIIKLKIDTSCQFLDEQYGDYYHRLNKPHNSGIIEADITIQTVNHLSQSNHLGIISTQAINQWLQEIPSLRCIVVIMKLFFQKKEYNQTYKGGLNTFSMIVLIVAYIYHAKLQKEPNPAKVLEGMLRFYSWKFDEKQTGIDLLDEKSSIFYSKSQKKQSNGYQKDAREQADLEILDPKCQKKNMARKCYLFSYIKAFFKEMLEFCFENKSFLVEKNEKNNKQSNGLKQTEKTNVFEMLLKKIVQQ